MLTTENYQVRLRLHPAELFLQIRDLLYVADLLLFQGLILFFLPDQLPVQLLNRLILIQKFGLSFRG